VELEVEHVVLATGANRRAGRFRSCRDGASRPPAGELGPRLQHRVDGRLEQHTLADRASLGAAQHGLVANCPLPGGPWSRADAIADLITGMVAASETLAALADGRSLDLDASMISIARQFAGRTVDVGASRG
jgi:hypothetical protein